MNCFSLFNPLFHHRLVLMLFFSFCSKLILTFLLWYGHTNCLQFTIYYSFLWTCLLFTLLTLSLLWSTPKLYYSISFPSYLFLKLWPSDHWELSVYLKLRCPRAVASSATSLPLQQLRWHAPLFSVNALVMIEEWIWKLRSSIRSYMWFVPSLPA